MTLKDVSALLKAAREEKEIGLEEVSASTHIRAHYLKAIEESDWDELREVYAVGYVREYARYLDMDAEDVALQFKAAYTHPAKLPLAEDEGSSGNFNSFMMAKHYAQVPGFSLKIPFAMLTLAFAAIYIASFSSVHSNEHEILRNSFAGKAKTAETATARETPGGTEQASLYVPVAYAPEKNTPAVKENNYILHSETQTSVRIYSGKHRLIETLALAAGDVQFVSIPEHGYAAADAAPEAVIVYTEDMQRKIGNIRELLPKR